MSFSENFKQSFAWGLGGALGARLGWAAGGFMTRWIKRLGALLLAGTLAKCAAFHATPTHGHEVVSKPAVSQPTSPRRHAEIEELFIRLSPKFGDNLGEHKCRFGLGGALQLIAIAEAG